MAYFGNIRIGKRVEIAPNCALYPYNHGMKQSMPIRLQECTTKGGIDIGDDAWLGFGAIILDGVQYWKGCSSWSRVTGCHPDIPDYAIALVFRLL